MEVVDQSDDIISRNQFTVDDLDIEILPLIYEIIRSVEKDPYDTSQKVKESQDTSQKILDLQKKLDSARAQIKRLPGIEYSKEEQLEKLETLRKQLKLKRQLLYKYRNIYFANNEQLVSKLAESRPIRKVAQLVVYLLAKTSYASGRYKISSDPREIALQLKIIADEYLKNAKKSIENVAKKQTKK